MATGYGICIHIVYGHRAISSTGSRGQPGVNPYRDCAEIVRKSCNVSAVAVQSPQPPHGNRTEPVRGSAFARCPCGIVQCHLRHVYGLRSYDFFQICKNFSLNQIVEAAEPVNPYENLTAASCLRREASRRPHGQGDTGKNQAKFENDCVLKNGHKIKITQSNLMILVSFSSAGVA